MDNVSLLVFFLGYIPELFITLMLGLLLVGIRPRLARVLLVAFIGAIVSYGARAIPTPVFGIHMPIITVAEVLLIVRILGVKWGAAILSVLMSLVAITIGESISVPLLIILTGIPLATVMEHPWLRIVWPLPHLAVMALLAWCCWKFDWALVRMDR